MVSETLKSMRAMASAEGWGPGFPEQEYHARKLRALQAMTEKGIDTLMVTSPVNIAYLTGYDMVWYYLRTPTGVAINAREGSTLFFDLSYHEPTVGYHAVVDELCCFDSFHTAIETMLANLTERGWTSGRFALESWSRNPNGNVLAALKAGLTDKGAEVVDASWLVDDLRLIKSNLEADTLRRAAQIADLAMTEVGAAIYPGMTEMELAGIALATMMREGGGDPAIRVAVRSGPRFVARHSAPSPRKLGAGELVWVNFCGSFHRYHADLGRLFSLGEPDARWVGLIAQASRIADEVLGACRPGDPTQSLQDSTESAVDAAGLSSQVALLGGYDMGIAIPPDWVGHTFTKSERGFTVASYDPGMTTNFEMLFKAGPDWRGGAGGGFIETVLMTPDGLEILSSLPRQITVT